MNPKVIILDSVEHFQDEGGERLYFVKTKGAALFPHQIEGLFALFKLFAEQLKTITFPLDQLDTFRLEAKCEDFYHEIRSTLKGLENAQKALTNVMKAITEIEKVHPNFLTIKLQGLSLLHLIDEMKRSPNLQAFLWLGFFLSYFNPEHPLLAEIAKWRKSLPEKLAYRTITHFSIDEETIRERKEKLKSRFDLWLEENEHLKPHILLTQTCLKTHFPL